MEIIRVVHDGQVESACENARIDQLLASLNMDKLESYRSSQMEPWQKEVDKYLEARDDRSSSGLLVGMPYIYLMNMPKSIGKDRSDAELMAYVRRKISYLSSRDSFAGGLIDDVRDYLKSEVPPSEKTIALSSAAAQYSNTKNLRVGTYTLHPADSKSLVRIESFHKSLAMEKDDELITLLGQMGAKKVRIYESVNGASKKGASGSVDGLVAGASTSANQSDSKDSKKEVVVEYEGNDVVIADGLLENSLWFKDDSQMNSIYLARKFSDNPIKQYSITKTYGESFDFDFSVAAKTLKVKAEVKAEYEALSQIVRTFVVEFA